MFNFTNFPRGRDLLSWPPAIAALAAAAIFFTVSAVKIVIRERAIASERGVLEEKIVKLQDGKEDLERAVLGLGSKEVVERMAKEKLNLKNPGEEVVMVAPPAVLALDDGNRGNFFIKLVSDWISQLRGFFRR